MFKKKLYAGIFLATLSTFFCQAQKLYNVNIVGFINDRVSLSRHTLAFIKCLQKDMPLTLIKSHKTNLQDIPEYLKNSIYPGVDLTNKKALKNALEKDFVLTGLTVFTVGLSCSWHEYLSLPNKSQVKIMYAVTERSVIPQDVVMKMNQNFDAIVVPDEWMIDIFKQSGVNLPIFVLPLVLDPNLQSLLTIPLKNVKNNNKPFVFGMTGAFTPRKNHILLLRAFAEEFGNNPNFKLKLHGASEAYSFSMRQLLYVQKQYQITNVEISQKKYSRQEYENFISSLDCYAFVSKGEGFSITPREALAAGIPCILSDNTAHKIICKSGLVCPVPSNIKEPAYYVPMGQFIGSDFNCNICDVRKALRNVYQNYNHYLALAPQGREWVKQYLAEKLTPRYLNLAKPKLVILGPNNLITDEYLMTNSAELYKKYQELCRSTNTVFKKNYDKKTSKT